MDSLIHSFEKVNVYPKHRLIERSLQSMIRQKYNIRGSINDKVFINLVSQSIKKSYNRNVSTKRDIFLTLFDLLEMYSYNKLMITIRLNL